MDTLVNVTENTVQIRRVGILFDSQSKDDLMDARDLFARALKEDSNYSQAAYHLASMAAFETADPEPNDTIRQPIRASALKGPKDSLFGVTSQILPRIVNGGGWETVIVIVNMGTSRRPAGITLSGTEKAWESARRFVNENLPVEWSVRGT